MVLLDIIQNQCPHCKHGQVFQNSNLCAYKPVKMNVHCPECNFNFLPEIGFYWGAMYVSYGLASFEGLLAMLFCIIYGNNAFDNINLFIIIATMVVLFPLNFRLSRLIWLYLFS